MKISNDFPPNYAAIQEVFPYCEEYKAFFCFGDTIYNPFGADILPDNEVHESVHSRQQEQEGGPEAWWFRYLASESFRVSQEIEAYGEQFAFAKKNIELLAQEAEKKGKVLSAGESNLITYALENMANALSSELYGNLLSYGEALSKIRNYSRAVVRE